MPLFLECTLIFAHGNRLRRFWAACRSVPAALDAFDNFSRNRLVVWFYHVITSLDAESPAVRGEVEFPALNAALMAVGMAPCALRARLHWQPREPIFEGRFLCNPSRTIGFLPNDMGGVGACRVRGRAG